MKIPYGLSNFGQIREEGCFYADKTTFLPVLESHYRHIVFLRPRRFGKSTLVSMLEHYYDAGYTERFDALFGGLVGARAPHPRAEQLPGAHPRLLRRGHGSRSGRAAPHVLLRGAVRGRLLDLGAPGARSGLARLEEQLPVFMDSYQRRCSRR